LDDVLTPRARRQVSIDPEDANVSETYVPKEGEPPGPAQAAFNGLVPGRAYNISVETVSEGRISDPTTAQYRTVPLRPHNVTFDPETIGPDYFTVRWSGPDGISEFDRYQVTIFLSAFFGSYWATGTKLRVFKYVDKIPVLNTFPWLSYR
jgi:hypothetical protein